MVALFRKQILILSMVVLGISSTALKPVPPHPFYISVTEINHNAGDKTVEVSCKIFTDDLEGALKKSLQATVDLSNAAQQEKAGALVNQYVQQHLRLMANGKAVPLKFLGYEKEAESVYC